MIELKINKDGSFKIIVALGKQDINNRDITCQDPIFNIIGQSSDHVILGINKNKIMEKALKQLEDLEVGNIISFNLNYFGLLSCITSPFVKKYYIKG